jgi:hypothetical protein
VRGVVESPITGPEGNVEFLIHATRGGPAPVGGCKPTVSG